MSKEERYYETGKDTVLYQNQYHRELSDRAVNLLNVGIAISVAGVGVISFRLDSISITYYLVIMLAVWGFGFGWMLWSCLSVLKDQDWKSYSLVQELGDAVRHPATTDDYILMTLADNFVDATQHNQRILDSKAGSISNALRALAIEITSVVCVILLVFLGALGAEKSLVCESKALLVG